MTAHGFPGPRPTLNQSPYETSRQLWTALTDGRYGQARPGIDRIPLVLPGRYMIADGSEFPCRTVDVSPLGLALRGLRAGRLGEWAVAYIEDVGRVEGVIAQRAPIWFVVSLAAPTSKLDKLARKLDWHMKQQEGDLAERRGFERFDQNQEQAMLRTEDGREYPVELIDVSFGGAAFNVGVTPPVGTQVTVDRQPARIARHFPGGVAVTFEP